MFQHITMIIYDISSNFKKIKYKSLDLDPTPNALIKVGQSLAKQLVVALGYNLTQYLFIRGEFWQIHHWMTFSSYILHAYKISRKLNIDSYVIDKLFKLQVFVI